MFCRDVDFNKDVGRDEKEGCTYGLSVTVRVKFPMSSRENGVSGRKVITTVVVADSRRSTAAMLPTDESNITSTVVPLAEMVMLAVALEKGDVVKNIADARGYVKG